MELFNKAIGDLGTSVQGLIVDGMVEVKVTCDLSVAINGLAAKTPNKIDDAVAAIAAPAVRLVNHDFASLSIGKIHDVTISKLEAKIVSGVLSAEFATDIPVVGLALTAETETKIDDMIVGFLAEALKALT